MCVDYKTHLIAVSFYERALCTVRRADEPLLTTKKCQDHRKHSVCWMLVDPDLHWVGFILECLLCVAIEHWWLWCLGGMFCC